MQNNKTSRRQYRRKFIDLEFGKKFLDTMPKQSMKEKYYCQTSLKLKPCSAKDTAKRMKEKDTDWEAMLAKPI